MRWAEDNASRLTGFEPDMPDFLHGRAADNWRPLLAVADIADGDWPKKAREVAELFQPKRRRGLRDRASWPIFERLSETLRQCTPRISLRNWSRWTIAPGLNGRNDKELTKAQMAKLLGLFRS